jgi:hypothetical protein
MDRCSHATHSTCSSLRWSEQDVKRLLKTEGLDLEILNGFLKMAFSQPLFIVLMFP